MAHKRRTPPRYKSGPKKGQFMSKRARAAKSGGKKRRRNPGRTVARRNPSHTRKRATTRRPVARKKAARRSYKRNPRGGRMPIMRVFTDGIVEAGQILVGKAAVRTIPDLIPNVSKEGNMGIAIQVGTALAIGWAADMFLSKNAARAMTAGALTAPLETLIVAYQVPWISSALAPVSSQTSLQAYVRGNGGSLGRYARRERIEGGGSAVAVGSERGLGRYATERGMDYGYR